MNVSIRLYRRLLALIALATLGVAHAGETVTYFHNDAVGSPLLATDANGLQVWKEAYRPYGDRLIQSAAAAANEVWFAGASVDEATGLSYMGARYYDATLGRFVAVDPLQICILDPHSLNRYAYANNNPFRFVDPTGESATTVIETVVVEGANSFRLSPFGFLLNAVVWNKTADKHQDQLYIDPAGSGLIYSEKEPSSEAADSSEETDEKPQETAKVRPGDGKKAYHTNKEFKRWFHKEYKPDVKSGSKARHNPDIDVEDGYEQWLGEGRPSAD